MKTRTQPVPNFAAALILGSLLGSGVSAQEARQTDHPRLNSPPDTVVSVDFAGGTLAELVEVIRGADEYINILIPPEASQVSVPSVFLKQVSVGNALKAIAGVCSNEKASVQITTQQSGWGQPVFTVHVDLARRDTAQPGSVATSVVVFSIRAMTESLPGVAEDARITFAADTILTAIDTGLNVAAPEGNKAQIRYHADSGLLFVRGTWEQNRLIESVLSSMGNDLERRRGAARRTGGGR